MLRAAQLRRLAAVCRVTGSLADAAGFQPLDADVPSPSELQEDGFY